MIYVGEEKAWFSCGVCSHVSAGEAVCVHLEKVVYPLMHWLMEDYVVIAQSARQALEAIASSSRLR